MNKCFETVERKNLLCCYLHSPLWKNPWPCIANSWLIYNRECCLLNKRPMPLKRFRLAVNHRLIQDNKPASISAETIQPKTRSRARKWDLITYGHWRHMWSYILMSGVTWSVIGSLEVVVKTRSEQGLWCTLNPEIHPQINYCCVEIHSTVWWLLSQGS